MMKLLQAAAAASVMALAANDARAGEWARLWTMCSRTDAPEIALDACIKLTSDGNESVFVYARMGELYRALNDPVAALGFFARALDMSPGDPAASQGYIELVPTTISPQLWDQMLSTPLP